MKKVKRAKVWDEILNSGKNLTDEEAEAMLETIKRLRKERGFRDIKF